MQRNEKAASKRGGLFLLLKLQTYMFNLNSSVKDEWLGVVIEVMEGSCGVDAKRDVVQGFP